MDFRPHHIQLYERENVETYKASDVVTFVGILSSEPWVAHTL